MAFVVLIARPVIFVAYELTKSQVLSPPFQARVRWQSHRHMLRQSLGFFQNDFAGRVANKLMQTAPAMRDSILQLSDAAVFVAVQWLSALALFWAADFRLTVPLLIWLVAYVGIVAGLVPRIRERSTNASEARSMLLGRVVDSYTNILTVKLFAHAEREDAYARAAIAEQTAKHQHYVRLTTLMTALLFSLNGLLIAGTTGLALWLWSRESITLGAIALVTGLVVRISQMSGWVLNLVTSIFENVGVVQEGMQTIAQPHGILDPPQARQLIVERGEIHFDAIGFNYGSIRGLPGADPARVIDGLSLQDCGGRESRIDRPLWSGQVDPRQPAPALLRP
jgi:ATP-binding cassette subfamily B multidrug efflux pump